MSARARPDRAAPQVPRSPVDALAAELIEASGHYGLRADKLGNATTLLGLSAVRRQADRVGLTVPEAALAVVRETVEAWPDARGRAILRSALGFDHGTERGRPNRLGLLAGQLNDAQPAGRKFDASYLDSAFTSRLARDLAAALLATEPPARRRRTALAVGTAAVLLIGLVVFVLLAGGGTADEPGELTFQPVPQRCSIDVCRSQASAVRAITGGFTPGGRVDVTIFTPSGEDALALGGPYAYRSPLEVNDEGAFWWQYWWDPGMETGAYRVRITDRATGRSVEASFEFLTEATSSS